MNQKGIYLKRNKIRQLIRMSNRRPNGLYWGTGETDNHIQMKLEICKYKKKLRHEFYSEAILTTGDRADILCVDCGIIYEVCESETMASLNRKYQEYPLPVIIVKAGQSFNEKLIM